MLFPELVTPIRRLQSPQSNRTLARPRIGLMGHYDGSFSDDAGERWFLHRDCRVSYNRYFRDDATVVSIADDDWRAWHAGACLTPDANSQYHGWAFATNGNTPLTPQQRELFVNEAVALFRRERWTNPQEYGWRIRSHHEEAVFTSAHTSDRTKWGKLGRRDDVRGYTRPPILDINWFRDEVARRIRLPAPEPVQPAPTPLRRPLLARGAGGNSDPLNAPHVHRLQTLLGMPANQRTGFFGAITHGYVVAFQKRRWPNDETQWDGKVGRNTWAALEGQPVVIGR